MREMQDLKAEPRAATGKGPAFQTRRKGLTPGIVYGGKGAAPQAVMIDSRELEKHFGTGSFLTTLFMLDIEGKKTRVIPREVQLDPVTDRPVHVDFMRLEKGATITLDIPGAVQGPGNLAGAEARRRAQHRAPRDRAGLPGREHSRIPDGDLSELDIDDSLHISAIALPEGVQPTVKRDFTVASVVAPTSMIEEQRGRGRPGRRRGRARRRRSHGRRPGCREE